MRLLISFCNQYENSGVSNLLVLDLVSQEKEWIKLDVENHGITGIGQNENYIFALYQLGPHGIVILEKESLKSVLVKNLEELRDPHSLVAAGDELYIASTSSDEILKYKLDGEKPDLNFVSSVWSPEDSPRGVDTHHVNSIFYANGKLYVSAFGPKVSERWHSAQDGYIYNITEGKTEIRGIYHPHSVIIKNRDIWYCESSSRSVKKNGQAVITLDSGYARGLALKDDFIFLGTSSGRKHSKSTGLTNNPADPGDLVEDCRLLIYKKRVLRNTYRLTESFDFLPDHKEIYDIMIMN